MALRLLVVWLGVAVVIVVCGLWVAPGPVVELRDQPETVLFAPRPPHPIIDVWIRWDSDAPGWIVLEAGRPWPAAAEPFWRRRVHPGWNQLVWDETGALPERAPVTLRMVEGARAGWAVGTPRAVDRHGIAHLGAFRGLAATLGLVSVLTGWTLASGGARVVRWLAGSRRAAASPHHVPGWALLALAAVTVAALGLRLHTLGAQSLWLDEVLTAIGAQSFTWVLYSPQVFGHPPLQYVAGWLAGVAADGAVAQRLLAPGTVAATDVWLRIPFVAAGVGTVGALGWLGCRLLGARTGVIAALVLAISPFHVELSQIARPYAFLLLFTVLSLLALVEALRSDSARSWLWFTTLTALAVYTHYLAAQVIVLEALLAALLIIRGRGRAALPAAVSIGGLGVLLWSWVPVFMRAGSNLTGAEDPGQGLAWLVVHVFVPQYLGPPPANMLALALLAWALWSLRRRPALVTVLALWLVLPFAALWMARPAHFIAGRHLAFVLPVALLVMASGVASVGTSVAELAAARLRWRRDVGTRAVFVLVALLVLLAWGVPAAGALRGYYGWRGGADWRTVASLLKARVPAGDRVIATAGAAYPLRYYWDDRVEEMDADRLLAEGEPRSDRPLWIVTHEGWDRPAALAAWLERHAIRVGDVPASWSLPGVRVYRWLPVVGAGVAAP